MTILKTIAAVAAAAFWALPSQAGAGELKFWSWRNEDKAVYAESHQGLQQAAP